MINLTALNANRCGMMLFCIIPVFAFLMVVVDIQHFSSIDGQVLEYVYHEQSSFDLLFEKVVNNPVVAITALWLVIADPKIESLCGHFANFVDKATFKKTRRRCKRNQDASELTKTFVDSPIERKRLLKQKSFSKRNNHRRSYALQKVILYVVIAIILHKKSLENWRKNQNPGKPFHLVLHFLYSQDKIFYF